MPSGPRPGGLTLAALPAYSLTESKNGLRTTESAAEHRRRRGRVASLRAFNRFYTKELGLLGRGFMGTDYTLTEARIIWELAQRPAVEVADLRRDLELDAGYVSRILARFERDGLVIRERSEADRRRQIARLTGSGRAVFRTFDRRSSEELSNLLGDHTDAEQRRVVEAMGDVRAILGDPARERKLTLREPEPGDHGWILERHAAIYAAERGWGYKFEAFCGQMIVDYVARNDHERERCWIAELDGVRCGSIYCERLTDKVAKLRLLLVEPWARGSGAGAALASACVDFARDAGYEQIMLFTNSSLTERPPHLRVARLRVPRRAAGGHLRRRIGGPGVLAGPLARQP